VAAHRPSAPVVRPGLTVPEPQPTLPTAIVVPLDGSERSASALPVAASLAPVIGATVTLLGAGGGTDASLLEAELGHRAARLRELGVREVVTSARPEAEPLEAIADAAGPGVLVCMATHGRSGPGRAVMGSVAEAVVRALTEPVLLVGPAGRPGGAGPLVLTVDGSDTSVSILPHALAWAAGLELEVAVVTVARPAGRFRERAVPSVDRVLDGVVGRCRSLGRAVCAEVLEADDVAGAVVDFAANTGAALVAMATHGRSGLARTALGSVAAAVVRRAPCPVLVVRPTA
jgi:nucleotide-binding universal stress UspA family protein